MVENITVAYRPIRSRQGAGTNLELRTSRAVVSSKRAVEASESGSGNWSLDSKEP